MKTLSKAGGVGAIAGLAAAIVLVPTFAFGNARPTVGSGAASAAVNRPLVADLQGASEVPGPGDPAGEGAAAVTIDSATGEICVDLRATGIATATAAHIHPGVAGVANPPLVTLTAPNPTSAQCVSVTPTVAAQIVANPAGFYVNVHNAAFPGGAIRGQLAASTSATGAVRLLDEPLRAYDSRVAAGGILAGETTRVVSLARGLDGSGKSQVAVPPGATGAIVTLTATDTVNSGFLKLYSNARPSAPATSTLNWYEPGAIVAANTTVGVDALSSVKVTAGFWSTHFVIDVVGFVY